MTKEPRKPAAGADAEIRAGRLQTVGQLTGGVAHDFNNLLTVILAYAGLLCDELAGRDAQLARMAEAIRSAAHDAAELNRQLLAFRRPHSSEPAEVDVGLLLKAMQRLLRPALGEPIELDLRLGTEPARVFVDPAQLEAALMGLALSGRDAMPEGGRLTIGTDTTPRADGGRDVVVALQVEPHGPNGAALKPPAAEGEAGLEAAHRLAVQAGGELRVEPAEARLRLPARAPAQASAATSPAPQPGGGEAILVVEDEPLVRELVVAQLRRLGYAVVEASDGPTALAEIERGGPFDLVFSDLVMPGGMSGFALAEAARRLRPGLRFLFTSGYFEDQSGAGPPVAPEQQILRKPYEFKELAVRIRWALTRAPS